MRLALFLVWLCWAVAGCSGGGASRTSADGALADARPDAALRDGGPGDDAMADAAPGDGAVTDAAAGDGAVADAVALDAVPADAGAPDALPIDAAAIDTMAIDAMAIDAMDLTPPVVDSVVIPAAPTDLIPLVITVHDATSATVDLAVQHRCDGVGGWAPITTPDELTGLAAGPGGAGHTIRWASR